MVVEGFGADRRSALSFEKRWKLATRRMMRAGSRGTCCRIGDARTSGAPYAVRRRARAVEHVMEDTCWKKRGLALSMTWRTMLGGDGPGERVAAPVDAAAT